MVKYLNASAGAEKMLTGKRCFLDLKVYNAKIDMESGGISQSNQDGKSKEMNIEKETKEV